MKVTCHSFEPSQYGYSHRLCKRAPFKICNPAPGKHDGPDKWWRAEGRDGGIVYFGEGPTVHDADEDMWANVRHHRQQEEEEQTD